LCAGDVGVGGGAGGALARFGKPGIFNTDQGSQFSSEAFTRVLLDHRIEISMDGRGRCHDNIFVERLRRTVKHERVYLPPTANGLEQKRGLAEFFDWYNRRRSQSGAGLADAGRGLFWHDRAGRGAGGVTQWRSWRPACSLFLPEPVQTTRTTAEVSSESIVSSFYSNIRFDYGNITLESSQRTCHCPRAAEDGRGVRQVSQADSGNAG
jgi:hypothetical protein